MYVRHYKVYGNHVNMQIPGHILDISIHQQKTNPPVVYNYLVNEHQKKVIHPQMRSAMSYSKLSTINSLVICILLTISS